MVLRLVAMRLVEKPLAINIDGLRDVVDAIKTSGNNRLMVGFNRRFSPLVQEINKLIQPRITPLSINYRVHAGQIESGSWYLDSGSQGSRFTGEAGHFFDLFSYLIQAKPTSVVARSMRPNPVTPDDLENITAIVEYDDGSVASLMYLTQGGSSVPKEYLEVFGGGRTIQLHNFEKITVYEGNAQYTHKNGRLDKGQSEEIRQLVSCIKSNDPMPIPLIELIDTTSVTLAVNESLRTGQVVNLGIFAIHNNR